jgi:glycosyltransferase involved in cell wall biosynthesis
MACGVPVVQPRRGAFPEIIEKTSGGVLVEPDNCDSLAEGILAIHQNPSLGAELSRNGYSGVREYFSIARMADRSLEVYDRLRSPALAEPV